MNLLPFDEWVKTRPADEDVPTCTECEGKRVKTCIRCNGNGHVQYAVAVTPFGSMHSIAVPAAATDEAWICVDCDANGYINCPSCAGSGKDYRPFYEHQKDLLESVLNIDFTGIMATIVAINSAGERAAATMDSLLANQARLIEEKKKLDAELEAYSKLLASITQIN